MTNKLPPPVPTNQHVRRLTPVRRTHTTNLTGLPEIFEPKPLKNLSIRNSVTPIRSWTRSPSPSSVSASAPRRIFPQVSASVDFDDFEGKVESPVVFDANLTFVLGNKSKVKQHLTPLPAYVDKGTTSNCLSNKISNFLRRTDHVMDEWKNLGHRNDCSDYYNSEALRRHAEDRRIIGRSRSATNIMIKGFQLFSRASSSARSSVTREFSEDRTEAEGDEVFSSKRSFVGLHIFVAKHAI